MKFLGFIAVLVLILFLAYPVLNEDAGAECDALEKRLINLAQLEKGQTILLGALQNSLSKGSLASELVKKKYPNLPNPIGCAMAYWQTLGTKAP